MRNLDCVQAVSVFLQCRSAVEVQSVTGACRERRLGQLSWPTHARLLREEKRARMNEEGVEVEDEEFDGEVEGVVGSQ